MVIEIKGVNEFDKSELAQKAYAKNLNVLLQLSEMICQIWKI